jgi:hypothetical protein
MKSMIAAVASEVCIAVGAVQPLVRDVARLRVNGIAWVSTGVDVSQSPCKQDRDVALDVPRKESPASGSADCPVAM